MPTVSEETQAEMAADRLMCDIRNGALSPGYKLRIAELKTLYGIGASPLREALSRVASFGYVTSESRRGYRVAEMSEADLADITRARQVIEVGMLRESMETAPEEWELGIVSSLERLRWVVQKSENEQRLTAEQVGRAHKQFHAALVGGCQSPRLVAMQDLLFDQASRYREILVTKIPSEREFLNRHTKLAEVVLGGDVEKAIKVLSDHLSLTLRNVYGGARV